MLYDSRTIKIAALTGGRNIPSARFRVRQYVPALAQQGVMVTEFPALFGSYPPSNRLIRPIWGLSTIASRVPAVLGSYRYDVTLLQRELLSTLSTLESMTKAPRVLDVDDAIWLNRDSRFAKKIAANCAAIICGNSYLGEWFAQWNSRVEIIPTGVDTDRYRPGNQCTSPTIGWTGTGGGLGYLYGIESALKTALDQVPNSKLRVVCDIRPEFRRISAEDVEFIRWSPENEVAAVQEMSVGIMPLEDTLWERGKCSYKMLLYMSCGIPVVVSPVGMNVEVLSLGDIGFAASSESEWVTHLVNVLQDSAGRATLGENGRRVVLEHFALSVLGPKIAAILRSAAV